MDFEFNTVKVAFEEFKNFVVKQATQHPITAIALAVICPLVLVAAVAWGIRRVYQITPESAEKKTPERPALPCPLAKPVRPTAATAATAWNKRHLLIGGAALTVLGIGAAAYSYATSSVPAPVQQVLVKPLNMLANPFACEVMSYADRTITPALAAIKEAAPQTAAVVNTLATTVSESVCYLNSTLAPTFAAVSTYVKPAEILQKTADTTVAATQTLFAPLVKVAGGLFTLAFGAAETVSDSYQEKKRVDDIKQNVNDKIHYQEALVSYFLSLPEADREVAMTHLQNLPVCGPQYFNSIFFQTNLKLIFAEISTVDCKKKVNGSEFISENCHKAIESAVEFFKEMNNINNVELNEIIASFRANLRDENKIPQAENGPIIREIKKKLGLI